MFQIENLNAGYGESQVLRDVSFGVAPRESVAVMGRNGMGKTTLLKALIGMLPARSGSIRLEGRELAGLESYQRVRSGLAFVPQGRMIFPFLTVEQNILAGAGERARAHGAGISVPLLSGAQGDAGAQGRQSVRRPAAAAGDRAGADVRAQGADPGRTHGRHTAFHHQTSRACSTSCGERGFAVVVSEQMLSFALDLADRFLVIDRGRIVHEEARETLDQDKVRSFLAV